MTPREEVLARIRAALAAADADSATPAAARPSTAPGATWTADALLDLLAERLADYRAAVRRTSPAGLGDAIAAALADRGARRVVVPSGLDLPPLPGVEAVIDDGLSPQDLDALDGVITGAAVAIAETGTIVLDGSPDQGRRAITLVPDYHLCVVRADQVVELVPEAIDRLAPRRPPAHLDQRPVGDQRHRTVPGRGRARSPHARGDSRREPVTRRRLPPWLPSDARVRPEQHGLVVVAAVRRGVGVMVEHVLQVLARRLHALDLDAQ